MVKLPLAIWPNSQNQ